MNSSPVLYIQPLLRNDEVCKHCIDGSLVSDWTRIPYLFAIVKSRHNNHGLVFFSYPGIGSTEKTITPKDAIPVDREFKFMIKSSSPNKPISDLQLQLTSKSKVVTIEFASGSATEKFVSILTDIYPDHSSEPHLFEWLNIYKKKESENKQSEEWPLTLLNLAQKNPSQPTEEYTPLAFDADDDILCFDPLRSQTVNTTVNTSNKESTSTSLPDSVTDSKDSTYILKDFDPLSPHEIEEGIKTEKMNADLLRSREVVSNKVLAGKSWLERTFSTSLTMNSKSESSNVMNGIQNDATTVIGPQEKDSEDSYDVVDNLDVQNVKNEELIPLRSLPLGSRSSSIFKGMRARENFINQQLETREREFIELYPFTVFVGTWNVNGQMASECLEPWLQSHHSPPDVYAIGFQELDLSAEALVLNESAREDAWITAIEKALPKSTHYYKLRQVRLVGMMLVVYVQAKHKQQVFDADIGFNGTGIMSMMGNKGGVAVRFRLHNTKICFVNSHLAAHLSEYERRNQDFREVYTKVKFSLFQPPLSIRDHDMVFWLGDLNYRFDFLEPDEVKGCVERKEYEKLYAYDQLNKQRTNEKVFQGFTEGPITFKPTYKYDPGTDQWDTSEKGRAPAWCDRVLWKGKNVQQLQYRSHPQCMLSDHKPVSALFDVGIKVVDNSKQRRVFEEIVWRLDKHENDSLPQVKLDKHEFQFGSIEFMEEKTQILPIINCGQSAVEFEFIPKLDETDICKPWVKITPEGGFISPGDFFEIELTVFVDKLSAPLITVDGCKLDEILVLHLVDGKDFFVPISGNYLPSVFGSSIEALVRLYGPIRQVPMDSLILLESVAANYDSTDNKHYINDTEPLEIPKELWLLIDHLHKYGMNIENILLSPGIDEDIVKIRHHLDTGEGGKIPGSIFSIGEALLLFLEALPEPVIPYRYHQRCLDSCNNYVLCKQIITELPQCHSNVFRYLTSFLRELLRQSEDNKLDAKILATVFGSILLRPPIKNTKYQNKRGNSQIAQKKTKFVFHFLVNDFRDFSPV